MKVLVVEDDKATAAYYKLALEARGHEVTIANGLKDCMEVYDRRLNSASFPTAGFEVVVLDFALTGGDGVALAKTILSINKKQKIIFASAVPKKIVSQAVRAGLPGREIRILTKPFDDDELCDAL